MQEKLLKKIILDFSGPGTEKLVDILYKKQNVNEFIIAKKLNMTINQTRNVLYKLADEGMVKFIRKKDKKKGGWYTYFWTIESKKILQKYKEDLEEAISHMLKQREDREKARYYYCINCDLEYDEESALLNDYTCTECGEILQMKSSGEIVENLKKETDKLKVSLAEVEKELEEIEAKEQKARERRLRIEQKKKEAERLKRRKEREKERKKLAKKLGKSIKKKPKKKSLKKKKPAKKKKAKASKKKSKKPSKKKPVKKKKKPSKKKKPVKKKKR